MQWLEEFERTWPPVIARSAVSGLTGGVLSRAYLAKLDHLGKGPKERVRIGRKVAYPKQALLEWMRERTVELL